MTIVGERKQAVLQEAVAAGFFDDEGKTSLRIAAAALNGSGHLARDPKRANLWYPTTAGLAELRAGAEEARALLASGDVMRARSLADVVYTQGQLLAKAAKGLDLRESLDACHRIQADALKISAHAQVRIADAWDDLAAAGKVLKGRPKSVPDENAFSAEEAGLDRKRIFEARKLRDREKAEPGFIDRVVEARVEAGLEPSRANLRAAIGTASAPKEDRGANFYQTPEVATRTLLAFERFSETVWEPACGLGAISRVLEAAGYEVRLSDLVDRGVATADGELHAVGDFLHSGPGAGESPDIVTNPPYGDVLNDFVAHALRVHRPRKMALLLNLNFLCGFADEARNFVMDENPPARVYVFKRRLPMMHREGWDGKRATSRMNTAWFVWERQADGTYGDATTVRRVDWAEFADSEALLPGAGGAFGAASFVERPEDDFSRTTPRKPLPERIAEERERARAWVLAQAAFTRAGLRQAIGVRDGVAGPLIEEFQAAGLVGTADEDGVFPVLGGGSHVP